jgi:hypothetical protein
MVRASLSSLTPWTGGDIFDFFSLLVDYLDLVIPLGISAAATSLMCLVSAKEAGDPYPVRESMIDDCRWYRYMYRFILWTSLWNCHLCELWL